MSEIYKMLVKEDSHEQNLLIEYNFLELGKSILKQIPNIKKEHQVGNGFEIFDMKLNPPEKIDTEGSLRDNEMSLDTHYM